MPERRLYNGIQITTTAVNLEVKIAFILLFVNLCLQGSIYSRFHTDICFQVCLLYLHKREVFDSTCVTFRHGEVWRGGRRFVTKRYDGPTNAPFAPKYAHATSRFAISEYHQRGLNDPTVGRPERPHDISPRFGRLALSFALPLPGLGDCTGSFNKFD